MRRARRSARETSGLGPILGDPSRATGREGAAGPRALHAAFTPAATAGTCYRAAGWIRVGATTGRGRNGAAPNRAIEAVWLRPLDAHFRSRLGACAVFFTQSPSFLAHQKARQTARGANNAHSLFGLEHIPCDNQIRALLDPVPPPSLYPVYDALYDALRQEGILDTFRGVHDSTLIALDGTWYHSSQKIHCPCCSSLEHPNGTITYYHSAVTPVIVAPGRPEVISLRPEFITPQDGHT